MPVIDLHPRAGALLPGAAARAVSRLPAPGLGDVVPGTGIRASCPGAHHPRHLVSARRGRRCDEQGLQGDEVAGTQSSRDTARGRLPDWSLHSEPSRSCPPCATTNRATGNCCRSDANVATCTVIRLGCVVEGVPRRVRGVKMVATDRDANVVPCTTNRAGWWSRKNVRVPPVPSE